jgi:hypothetical protein
MKDELQKDLASSEERYSGDLCMKAIESAGYGESFCAGNVIKYVWRYKKKGGVSDLKKAKWYLERLISLETK